MGEEHDAEDLAAIAEAMASVVARAQLGDPDYRLDGTPLGDELVRFLDSLPDRIREITDAGER